MRCVGVDGTGTGTRCEAVVGFMIVFGIARGSNDDDSNERV